MASTTPLKPSILDKLIADIGRKRGDGSRDAVPCFLPDLDHFNEAQLRMCIKRDIGWILNDIHFEAAVDLTDFPDIQTSVLNQGLPDLAGTTTGLDGRKKRASDIVNAVRAFEQRLRPDSIVVETESDSVDNDNKLHFAIQGEIRNSIDENWIELQTTVDVDDGRVEISS